MFKCRIIQSFTFAALLLTAAQAFSFPNMREYPHECTLVENRKTATSRVEDAILIRKMKYGNIDGLYGDCEVTGYSVFVPNDGSCCLIMQTDANGEVSGSRSDDYIFLGKVDNFSSEAFYFDEGRLMIIHDSDEKRFSYAIWQTFVEGRV